MDLKSYLKTHNKTHLIFDLDETILHLIMPWNEWERDIEDQLKKIDGKIFNDYKNRKINLNQMQNAYISSHPQTKNLIVRNNENFESKYLKEIRVNQKLVNLIKNLKGYQLSIWSANSKSTIKKTLKKVDILEKFKKLITRDDVDFLKPDSQGFNKIWDHKTPKSKYVFIGDSTNDKNSAHAAGIDFYKEDYFK